MKYLLLVLGLVVAYWVFKALQRKRDAAGRAPGAQRPAGEDMVRCAECGVHLPRSESVKSGEAFFCTPEHVRLHRSTD